VRLAQPALPSVEESLRVEVIRSVDALVAHVPALEELAAHALEPNVFHEPILALPALRSFSAGKELEIVCVYRSDPGTSGRPARLSGFFPFERVRRYRGLPVAALRSFQYPHCFLGTPLLRQEAARETVAALFDWLRRDSRAAMVELRSIGVDGPVHQLLAEALHERRLTVWLVEWFTRALFRPAPDADSYLRAAMSGHARKEARRKEKRLGEQGRLVVQELQPGADARPWLDDFLRVEASGWKGRERSAIACSEPERDFFVRAALGAHERGRLMLLGSFLDDRPLALKCNFLAGEGGFAFKIAFDEAFAAFSPGFLLEMENVRRLHERPNVRWMDSCASPQHVMIDRLWQDRRTIASLLFSTGRPPGEFLVSLLPLLRWGKRSLSP
jgi:CelD/BcsL family acetyltransferase involved in cellulose biosynthesis